MMVKAKRFICRADNSFLHVIDDWRATQRPLPSRSEAIRQMALRGVMADYYLDAVIAQQINDLRAAGVLANGASVEICKALRQAVLAALDDLAQRQRRHLDPSPDGVTAAPLPEKPALRSA